MEQYFRAEIPARWDVFQHGHNLKLISTPTPCEFYWDTIPSFRYFHKATYRTNYTRLIGTLCSAVSDAVLYVNTVCVHQQSNIKLDQRVKKKAGLLSVLWELLQACWKIIMKLVDRIPRVSIALKCTFRAPGPVLSSRYCPILFNRNTYSFVQISSQPNTWQQYNADNPSDTGRDLQLTFRHQNRGEKQVRL